MDLSVSFSGISSFDNAMDHSILIDLSSSSTLNVDSKMSLNINYSSMSTFDNIVKVSLNVILNGNSILDIKDIQQITKAFIYNSKSNFDLTMKLIGLDDLILVLSPDLELLAYLETYQDFVWDRRWRKVDSFELTVNKNLKDSKFLRTDCYVALKQGDMIHAGRIKNREIKKSQDNEIITVSGKGLGEIFENRIAFHNVNTGTGYDSFSGSAESAMKYYVNVNVMNPDDPDRKVSQLEIARDKAKGNNINYSARFQKISEILYEIAKTTGLGWDLQLDLQNKKFIFEVLNANMKMEVRLNPDMDSVKMIDFKESKSSSENTILIAGQGTGADREMLEVSRNEV